VLVPMASAMTTVASIANEQRRIIGPALRRRSGNRNAGGDRAMAIDESASA